jgi:hypothetical protein
MDNITRLVLIQLGWTPHLCRDAKGNLYESWTRGISYFHVYHEKNGEKVVRP